MACYLRIFGAFDPDELAATSKAPIQSITRKGEDGKGGLPVEESGIQLLASNAEFNDYDKMLVEAEAFLRRFEVDIAALIRRSDTSAAILDFGLAQERQPAFYRRIPSSLVEIAAALKLSIELSFYSIRGLK